MLRRLLIILALLGTALAEVKAQYEPSFSHYWAMQTAYNPAAAGRENMLNVDAAYNMTLTGF